MILNNGSYFFINTNTTFSSDINLTNLRDTFYVQVANQLFDMLIIQSKEEITECFGAMITNYAAHHNGTLICQHYTIEDEIIIFK